MSRPTVLEILADRLDDLGPMQRRTALAVLDDPGGILQGTVSGVDVSALRLLAVDLDLSGAGELRVELSRLLESRVASLGGALPRSPAAPVDVEEFTIDLSSGGVPCTLLGAATDGPLILFSVGFGASRRDGMPPGRAGNDLSPTLVTGLLDAGYRVLLVENPEQGERLSLASDPVEAVRAGLVRRPNILDLTQSETPALLDHLVRRNVVDDPGRVATVGHSWGALNAMLRLAGDVRIACCVAVIPVVDPSDLVSLEDLVDTLRGFSLADRLAIGRRARPLLLVSGALDGVAPESSVRHLLDVSASGAGGISWSSLPDVAHRLDPREVELMVEFLRTHLPVDGRPAGRSRRE